MTDYANMERPAIVRTTDELGIKTSSERLKAKAFYGPFTDEYVAIVKGDGFSARAIFDTNDSNRYILRTDIGPNPTLYFKHFSAGGYDFGLSLRLGDDDYALEIEPSLLDGHFGFGLKTPIGFFGPMRLDSDKAVQKAIKGAKRTVLEYAILGNSKPAIPGKFGGVTEHIVAKTIVEGVIGKTPYGLGVTLLKRLFRGVNFKKANPRNTSSAMTTTDEYRMNIRQTQHR